jgi:hypothetical protein
MHVIRNTRTGELVFIDHSSTPAPLPGEAVYRAFDAATMQVGWTDKPYVPVHFDIDDAGRIVELSLDEAAAAGRYALPPSQKLSSGRVVDKTEQELVDEGILKLDDLKSHAIEGFSDLAFRARRAILPDYRLQNALLGIYDDATAADYKATVQAFRDEFYRLKGLVEEARDVESLRKIAPEFPHQVVPAAAGRKPSGGRRAKQ